MALAHYQGYVENVSTGKALEGAVIRVYSYPGNVLQSTFADASSTPKPVVSSDSNGGFDFYIADGAYDLEYVYNGDVLERLVNVPIFNPANYAPSGNVDTILGVPAADGDLGTFTGTTIANDSTVKVALQALETATELRPTSAALAASGGSALVGFLQAGTGAVARTGQDKWRDEVNVKDFMGVLSTAGAFQAAITSLGANGGKINVPAGTYTLAATVNIPLAFWKPVVISGAGNTIIASTHDGIVFNDSTGNIRFENLRFHGPGLGNVNSKAIVSILSQGSIRDCYFQDYRVGIDITASSGALIQRCHFTLCQEGIRSVSVSPAFSNFALIQSCWFDFCTFGCYFDEMYGVTLDNNAFEYNAVGFFANSVRLLNLRGCNWFELNTTNAFQIDGSSTGEIGKETRIVGLGYTIDYTTCRFMDYAIPSICVLTKSGTQAVAHNTDTNVTWETETLDPAGLHTGTSDQIVIKSGGFYEIVANVEIQGFAAGTTNTVFSRININKNGTAIKFATMPTLVSQPTQMCLVTREELSNGDIIRLQAYQNSGGSLNVSAGTLTQISVRQLSID